MLYVYEFDCIYFAKASLVSKFSIQLIFFLLRARTLFVIEYLFWFDLCGSRLLNAKLSNVLASLASVLNSTFASLVEKRLMSI